MAAKVETEKCVGCEACVGTCPVSAIAMKDGVAEVNADECIDCGSCAGACPTGSIEQQ